MRERNRIIIDTDPGVDDILALLLAFASKPEELEVVLISVTFGNIDVQNCLRNVVSLFHIIEKEQQWRRQNSKSDGFDTLRTCRPVVAVGAEEPLADQRMMADYFHGADGLGGIHTSHPHLTPSETWRSFFNKAPEPSSPSAMLKGSEVELSTKEHHYFTPSKLPAHKEILRTLKDNPIDTITIVAIGPLTNLALAAAEDTETFLRVKEVVVMGGAIDVPGNITPLAEFNTHADPLAAALILALTSPSPPSTMPPQPLEPKPPSPPPQPQPSHLKPYPTTLPRRLTLTLFPLDITSTHLLTFSTYTTLTTPLLTLGSPLAEWTTAFLAHAFRVSAAHAHAGGREGLSLHDPLCVWYALTNRHGGGGGGWKVLADQDIRVETGGQWTRGACIVDRRGRARRREGDVAGDGAGWLSAEKGNRVGRAVGSPMLCGGKGEEEFGGWLIRRVFGLDEEEEES